MAALVWRRSNRAGQNESAFDGDMLVAKVVWYGVGGLNDGPWWAAFVVQDRVPGQFATKAEAKAAAERVYAEQLPEPGPEPRRWRRVRNRPD